MPEQQVWVAFWNHEHGYDMCVFSTPEKAQAWKDEIGLAWWEDETDEPLPVENVGDAYFDMMAEKETENFNVEMVVVDKDGSV